MRLICPNCDAEYQVDDAAIPDAGRDVQCSNCGHGWFQRPVEAESAEEAEEALFGLGPEPGPGPEADSSIAEPAGPVQVSSASAEMSDGGHKDDAAAPDAVEPAEPPVKEDTPRPVGNRQSIAESVLSVLREEAERESASRRDDPPTTRQPAFAGSMETQTELGFSGAGPAGGTSAAARHIAKLKGIDPDLPLVAEPKAAARRDLLPDIEEINSTLRTESDRAAAQMDQIDALPDIRPRRRGFRSGFVLVMVIAVALAMAYVMAPRIIAQMPGAAPSMRAYVATVDQGRHWLDGVMKSASGSLRSFGGSDN